MMEQDEKLYANDENDLFGLLALARKIERLLASIPRGLDDFKVDKYYVEEFLIEFAESGYDPQLFHDRVASLPLFSDRGSLSRSTRIKMEELGMKDKVNTQKEFVRANRECAASTPHAMAGYIRDLTEAFADVAEALRELAGRIDRALEAKDEQLAELADQLQQEKAAREEVEQRFEALCGKAIDKLPSGLAVGATASAPAAEEKEKPQERKLTKAEQAEIKRMEDEAEKRRREAEQEERKAWTKEHSREIALKILDNDEALVDRLLEGLPAIGDKVALWEYVERVLCIEAHVSYTTAYNDKLCEVLAANVGYSTKGSTLHTQMGEYLRDGHRSGRY